MNVKKIIAAVPVVMLITLSNGAYAKDWSTLRFGVEASYAPFESKTADGRLVGLDIDIGTEICARMQARCEWVENDFDGLIPALKAKKFDGILSSMSITKKREEQIAFSSKLYAVPARLVARKGTSILPTPESLAGKRVGVEQGTIYETYANSYWAPKGVTIVPYQSQPLIFTDLVVGRLDAAFQDTVAAESGLLDTPRGAAFEFAGSNLVDPKILGNGSAIGMRKEDRDLKDKIDKAIAEMVKDGTYKKIEEKYLKFDIQ